MLLALTIALALALAAALIRLLQHRRALRMFAQSIVTRQHAPAKHLPRQWRDASGEINELVSENNRLQRLRSGQLAQLEATLGSLQEAVLIIGQDNVILLANRALQSIFPGAATALNQRFERVIHSAAFLEYVEAVRNHTARPQHEIAFTDGHETRWVEITGAPIPAADGSEAAWSLFVFHDITRQKKLEAVRKEFVANVSHELRTPLSVIKGYAETLVDGHREMPADDRDRFLRTIHRHSERLTTLIEDLLSLSRLESGNPGLRIERASLPKLINTIVDDYRARPAAKAHALSVEIDERIGELNFDTLKLTQVFENLIGNALKYSPPGSRINVTARQRAAASGGAHVVEVCVRDNGHGIPAADLPHIFERFYRVDKGRSRDTGGTGLGLSIVKHIVQLHGGRVRVESDPGQGAAFFFTLPV